MVRLQHTISEPNTVSPLHFQSHYGAIATVALAPVESNTTPLSIPLWCDCNVSMPTFTCPSSLLTFNPTMVRLQRSSHLCKRKRLSSFNPTMVRLQLTAAVLIFRKGGSFNPTMVRLQRSNYYLAWRGNENLSIPLWCDCNSPPA